jgi:nicotinamidase-related amidase
MAAPVPGPTPVARPRIALLILDMINPFDFPGGGRLRARTARIVPRLLALKARVRESGGHCLYVNDNFGRWQSEFGDLLEHVQASAGADIAGRIAPDREDRSVLKPKHSGFFQTPLELLLEQNRVDTVVVTGIATDSCVLTTALDAHMRDLRCLVPSDCTEAMTDARKTAALTVLRGANIETRASRSLDLG